MKIGDLGKLAGSAGKLAAGAQQQLAAGANKLADVGKLGDAGKLKQLGELGLSKLPADVVQKAKTAALPAPLKQRFETQFGTDFSNIRIIESHAATLAGAMSFANGNEIHFAPGKFQPFTEAGEKLLAHEMAHVVQQRGGRVASQAQSAISEVENAVGKALSL